MDDETVKQTVEKYWDEVLEDWKEDLKDGDVELLETADLIDDYEFFWDGDFDRVGYEAPSVPKDWKTREYADEVQGWSQVSRLNVALDELGQTLREHTEKELGVE